MRPILGINNLLNNKAFYLIMKKAKKNFWGVIDEVINKSDIIISIIDARFPEESRNKDIERMIKEKGKSIIFAVNKCDLVDKRELNKVKVKPRAFISSTKYSGIITLKEKIMIESKRRKIKTPKVGVVGYPNVGKSSLINALSGKKSARVSSESGFTKGKQYIKFGRIMLVDTPGVIPSYDKDLMSQAKFGAVGSSKVEDPVSVLVEIMENNAGIIEKFYGVEIADDKEETIEEIAKEKHCLIKGGKADMDRISRRILKLLQEGKIR